jgi:hypothetical protein
MKSGNVKKDLCVAEFQYAGREVFDSAERHY